MHACTHNAVTRSTIVMVFVPIEHSTAKGPPSATQCHKSGSIWLYNWTPACETAI